MKLVERELGPSHVSADIGCHLFSILPPFNIGNTTMGYGLGSAGASAFRPDGKRAIAVMGDGGFWHNGLTSGIGNAVFNQDDTVTLIVDNGYSAATGGQDILSSRAANRFRTTNSPIEKAVRGVGAGWVRTVTRTYDVKRMRETLRDALTAPEKGPESHRRAIRMHAEQAAPRKAAGRQRPRARAGACCANASGSIPIPAPAITAASGCRAVRRSRSSPIPIRCGAIPSPMSRMTASAAACAAR